jgi:hypothetical protein
MRQKRARVERNADNEAAGKKRIIMCNCNDPGQVEWLILRNEGGLELNYSYFKKGKYDGNCIYCRSPYWYKICV